MKVPANNRLQIGRGLKGKARVNEHSNKYLTEAVNKSSEINRVLGITFALFLFYIFVNVANTKDVDLVNRTSLAIPLLSVGLPIFSFYILAPLILVLLHYNLLFNLNKHSQKLKLWLHSQDADRNLLHPFLFNYLVDSGHKVQAKVLSIIIYLTIYLLPLAVLLFLQLRFLDAQYIEITIWHIIVILTDIFILDTHTEGIKYFFNPNISSGSKPFLVISQRRLIYLFGYISVLVFPWLLMTVTAKFDKEMPYYDKIRKYIPRVEIFYEDISASNLSDRMFNYATFYRTKFPAVIEFSSFSQAFIVHSDLQYSYLESIKFNNTSIVNSNFRYAKIKNSDLGSSDIHGDFKHATFEIVNFGKSTLRGEYAYSNFRYCNLNKADLVRFRGCGTTFHEISMNDVNLENAYLDSSDISGNVRRSNLTNVRLSCSKLNNVHFQGSIFCNAFIIGSDLTEANFDSTDLFMANIQGSCMYGCSFFKADLVRANLYSSLLQNANFTNANLFNSQLSRCDLRGAIFNSSNLSKAKLLYSYLDGEVEGMPKIHSYPVTVTSVSYSSSRKNDDSLNVYEIYSATFNNATLTNTVVSRDQLDFFTKKVKNINMLSVSDASMKYYKLPSFRSVNCLRSKFNSQ